MALIKCKNRSSDVVSDAHSKPQRLKPFDTSFHNISPIPFAEIVSAQLRVIGGAVWHEENKYYSLCDDIYFDIFSNCRYLAFFIFTHKDIPLDITIETDIMISKHNWAIIGKYGEAIRIYALDEAESEVYLTQDLGWKVILFRCKFNNASSKEFSRIQLYYAEEQELPSFIFGKRLGAWGAEELNLKRFQRDVSYAFGILVKDEGYSDEELIEKIMDIKLVISLFTGTPISEPFKIRDVIHN